MVFSIGSAWRLVGVVVAFPRSFVDGIHLSGLGKPEDMGKIQKADKRSGGEKKQNDEKAAQKTATETSSESEDDLAVPKKDDPRSIAASIDDELRQRFAPQLALKKVTATKNPYAEAMGAAGMTDPNAAASAPAASAPASAPPVLGSGSASMPIPGPIPLGFGSTPIRYIGPLPQFAWDVGNAGASSGGGGSGSGPQQQASAPMIEIDPETGKPKMDPMCENLKTIISASPDFVSCEDYRYYGAGGWVDSDMLPSHGCYCLSKSEACPLEKGRGECGGIDTSAGSLMVDCLDEKALNLGLGSFSKISVKSSDTSVFDNRDINDGPVVSTGCLYLKKIQPSLPKMYPDGSGSGSGSAAPGSSAAGSAR